MKPVLIFFIMCLSYQTIGHAPATAQFPDKILFKGKEFDLQSNPLEGYFKNNPELRPKGGLQSTALWRGYVATFEMVKEQLVVKDIKIKVLDEQTKERYDKKWVSVYDEVFAEPLRKADWYSGILILPYGERINYVHMGYASTYSDYWLLEIANGKLTETRNYDHQEFAEFRERQLNAYMKTDEYKALFDRLKNPGDDEASVRRFIKNYVTDYATTFLDQ